MATFNYPFHVEKDTPAVAAEVQTNFDDLLAWLLANLVQRDGTVTMTGPLVLAPGPPGAPDHAANKAYVDASMPVGMIVEYAGTGLPAGWLWCDGQTYSVTSQQPLHGAIGRTYTAAAVPQTSFQVPNLQGKFLMGAGPSDPLGKGSAATAPAGQRDSELRAHSHVIPAHGHTASTAAGEGGVDHLHGPGTYSTGGRTAAHTHISSLGTHTEPLWRDSAYNTGYGIDAVSRGLAVTWGVLGTESADHGHAVSYGASSPADRSLNHGHTITVVNQAAFNTQDGGAGTTYIDKNLPPYVTVNYIIFAGGM